MNCRYCTHPCVKAGFRKSGVQKFLCSHCKKYQQSSYQKKAYELNTNQQITQLLVEGLSIRGIARILRISLSTVIARIKRIAKSIRKPYSVLKQGIYEIDELWTYISKKTNEIWIMYILDRKRRAVIDFIIGSRTKTNLKMLTDQLLFQSPEKICTDGLKIYQSLLPEELHRTGLVHTRHIERNNLNIRTHLKRLSRKTICFSRSSEMLNACLKIYFWQKTLSLG